MQTIISNFLKASVFIACFTAGNNVNSADFIVVPKAKLAGELAEVVLPSIYGKDVLNQKPFKITEKDGYWHVDGQLPTPPKGSVVIGGTVHCEIRKSDGAFRNITHGK